MRRALRPAFVVTLAACSTHHAVHGATPPPVPSATAKRTRHVASAEPKYTPYAGALSLANTKQLNPRDADGREIKASRDGSCYVELPFPAGKPIPPPGAQPPTRAVDCPDAMQDAAWDTCFDAAMFELANGDCVCLLGGNPPPAPAAATCPGGKGTIAR